MTEFSWKDEFTSRIEYKRKFAFLPTKCVGTDKIVWLKQYYTKYMVWSNVFRDPGHKEVVEHVSDAEYIVRVLSGRM